MSTGSRDYPLRLEVDIPESPSRLMALLGIFLIVKMLLLLPHIVIMYFLAIAQVIILWLGYWVVLFTGSYSEGLFNFTVGVSRWQMRMNAWYYGWTDRYPPFSLD